MIRHFSPGLFPPFSRPLEEKHFQTCNKFSNEITTLKIFCYGKAALKNILADYFAAASPVIGFSALSGRDDLFVLAKELRDEGAVTILAGPQANVDFAGEEGWQNYPHRFRGLSENFNFGLHGPAEQVIELLNRLEGNDWSQIPGLLYLDRDRNILQNPPHDWNAKYIGKVRWDNIYKTTGDGIVPFELINENPLPDLPGLILDVNLQGIGLSQINLTLRADWLIAGFQHLKEALRLAGESGVYVLLSSIGFESFDDAILRNLNKGLSVEKNIDAIRLIRQLKEEFPHSMGYSSQEGANHGFIHPTPWDTGEVSVSNQKTTSLYGLQNDILPPHSTPLIILHASGLGHWIREIERREEIWFKRYGSIIGWWEGPNHF